MSIKKACFIPRILERRGKDEWVSTCRNVFIVSAKGRDRNKNSWEVDLCSKPHLKLCGLMESCATWRGLIVGSRPICASMEKTDFKLILMITIKRSYMTDCNTNFTDLFILSSSLFSQNLIAIYKVFWLRRGAQLPSP